MVSPTKTPLSDPDLDAWLDGVAVPWSEDERAVVRGAHALAAGAGEAAVLRGLAVADALVDLRMDHEAAAAALAYQAVAAGTQTLHGVEERLGPGVGALVDALSRLELIGELFSQGRHGGAQIERLRKMLLAMARDVRGVVIALVARRQRMRDLDDLDLGDRRRLAQETLDIFAPLANRLGIAQLKWELEDLALRHLDPESYRSLARALAQRRAEREGYIHRVVARLRGELERAGIGAELSGRVKHIYSIWKKMQRKRLPFEEIFDVRAVRILVHSTAECYGALGVVHSLWNHIPAEFDDYIANPKPNGYRSLHTAVIGPEGKTLEVQIRTHAMHHNAELGVAAHWRYKEGGGSQGDAMDQQIAWLRQMLEWGGEDGGGGEDFLDRLRAEALQDRVYVVTPQGAVIELPRGATPLDFAYHVHTEVGHRCRGAKVNGRIVPLSYQLHTGEQVEVLTARNASPSRDWLSAHLGYVTTTRARSKIRHWFRLQDRDKSIAAGRVSLEREFARLGLAAGDLEAVARRLNLTTVEDLHAALGHGDVTTGQVLALVQELGASPTRAESLPLTRRPRAGEGGGDISIRGVGNLLTQMARCCKPVPRDAIVGYITQGRGVTVHRSDCPNLLDLAAQHRERLVEVDWGEPGESLYPVEIQVEAYDRQGLLRDITSILANERVNVTAVSTRTDPETSVARMALSLEIADLGQLSRILDKLGQLPNVVEVRRRT